MKKTPTAFTKLTLTSNEILIVKIRSDISPATLHSFKDQLKKQLQLVCKFDVSDRVLVMAMPADSDVEFITVSSIKSKRRNN
jgi:hypothetical protein